MFRNRHFVISSVLSGAVAIGGAGLLVQAFHPTPAIAADEKKDKDHMSRADRVRDALDHLKKAKEQLETANVDEKGHDGAAFLKVKEAITECDKYIEEVDKGKEAK